MRGAGVLRHDLFWQWMRFPGDVVFALGALLMAWDFHRQAAPALPAACRAADPGLSRECRRTRRWCNMSIAARATWRAFGHPTFLTLGFRPFFLAAASGRRRRSRSGSSCSSRGGVLPSRFDPLDLAYPRNAVRLCDGGDRRFPADRDPELDRATSGQRVAVGVAGRFVAARPYRLLGLGAVPRLARRCRRSLFSGGVWSGVVAREIIAGRNWRNLPMVAPVTVLGIANLLMHLEADWRRRPARARMASRSGRRDRADLGGGWPHRAELYPELAGEAPDARLPLAWLVDRAALGTLHAGLIGWAFFRTFAPVGVLLLLGAVLNLWRLAALAGQRDECRTAAAHPPYRLRLVGASVRALLGLSMLDADLPQSAAIHALTAARSAR